MNRWKIPPEMEALILERDKVCVYCGCEFTEDDKKTNPTWEHITNDAKIISLENICRSCFSCNASKGAIVLKDWLTGSYCKKKGISKDTVAEIVKAALIKPPKREDNAGTESKDKEVDQLLQWSMQDQELEEETWVMLSGSEFLQIRKHIEQLRKK